MARPRTTPQDTPTTAPAPEDLLPAPPISLRKAVRMGLIGGLTVVFVSAIGMVERFAAREILGQLTLGYALLLAIPVVFGYLVARPAQQLEGFAPSKPGGRNLLAGLIAGILTGALLLAFAALVGTFNIRGVFTNVTPRLVDILTFDRGLGTGSVLLLVGGTALGVGGASLHLLPDRWRVALLSSLGWVLTLGVLEAMFRRIQFLQTLEFGDVSALGLLYERGGGLRYLTAVVLGIVIFALYFFLRGRERTPIRERVERQPASRRKLLMMGGLALGFLLLGAMPHIVGRFMSQVLDTAGIFLLLALGLNIVVGFAGLLDLGYVAFFAVGAYTAAVLTSPASPAFAPELTFWLALPFVIMACAVAGIMVGTPVLRMRGDYLAIVTLGFGEIARLLVLSDWLRGTFGGAQGIIRVPRATASLDWIPGVNLGAQVRFVDPQAFFYLMVVFVLLAVYISYALQDSRIGRAWMAMREDEPVAEAMGVSIVTAKLSAFVMGAVLAGFGGALFASKLGSIFPQSFDVIVSITVLVVVIVGGLGSAPGVILSALVLVGLPQVLREFDAYRFLIYGALLIFMMVNRPEGFIPSRRRAQELREEEVLQDAWFRAQEEAAEEEAEATTGPEPEKGT